MSVLGRIISGARELPFGGPLGALLRRAARHLPHWHWHGEIDGHADPRQRIAFTIAVIALGAKMARADGDSGEALADYLRAALKASTTSWQLAFRRHRRWRRTSGTSSRYPQCAGGRKKCVMNRNAESGLRAAGEVTPRGF